MAADPSPTSTSTSTRRVVVASARLAYPIGHVPSLAFPMWHYALAGVGLGLFFDARQIHVEAVAGDGLDD